MPPSDLQNSDFVLRQLLLTTQEGYWYINNQGKTLDVNPALCRILGRDREEILGKSIYDFVDEENKRVFENQLALRQKGIADPYEIALSRPDGSKISCINAATPVYDDKNEKLGSIGLWTEVSELKRVQTELSEHRDNLQKVVAERTADLESANRELQTLVDQLNLEIKERARAEEELRTQENFLDLIIENIPDMIFVKEPKELRFVRLNKAGEDLLGLKCEELIGKNDFDFFPENQTEFFVEKDREVLQSREILDIPEEPIETRDKGRRILHTKKLAVYDESGEPMYLIGIAEDITLRKEIDDLKSQFVSLVSHELRTPLTSIMGSIGMLHGEVLGKLPENVRGLVEIAHSNSQRLADLVNDILDFEKLESGNMELNRKPISIVETIEHAMELNLPYAAKFGIDLNFEYHEEPQRVLGDTGRVVQVMTNLLSSFLRNIRLSISR